MQDTVNETTHSNSHLDQLVAAANAEKAAQKASEFRDLQKETPDTDVHTATQEIPQVDKSAVFKRITEISYELADLEERSKAGDKSAAGELTILLNEQQQLQNILTKTNQVEHKDTALQAFLQRFIGRPLERLFGKLIPPDNQPLETLRTMAWQSWLNERKAAGKSNLLNIPATLKAMMMMRQSPQELANRIANTRTTTENTHSEPRVDVMK